MRISELTTYTSRLNGGVFYALTGLLPEVVRKMPDSQIHLLGYADRHTRDDAAAWGSVGVEAIPPWPPRHFGYSPRFYTALSGFSPDLIHAHGLWTYLSAAALKEHRRRGTPVVISPHGMLDPWALGFSRSRKRIVAALFQDALLHSASVIHALNASEAAAIRAYGLSNPIVVIPNGVSLPPTHSLSLPWNPSASGRDRVLLFLGRIHPKKGLDLLLKAWPGFTRPGGAGERWRLVIAGWDEIGHESDLKASVLAAGIGDSVNFVGPLFGEAKRGAFASADAFVLPSRSEGLPMAVLEAWSHGKPALISRACNLPEGAMAGAAFEVDPESDELGEGLARLAELGDERRAAMGQAGRNLVERRFVWERIARDFERVYRAVAAGTLLPQDLLYKGADPTNP